MRLSLIVWSRGLFLTGLLSLSLAHPRSAGAVQCGDTLSGDGTTVVLEADLTCASLTAERAVMAEAKSAAATAGVRLEGAVTLDLNGHTLSCGAGVQQGIHAVGAKVRNGTVTGCAIGVATSGAFIAVQDMVFSGNSIGLLVQDGRGGIYVNNTATENETGFAFEESIFEDGSADNVLLNNTATRNSGVGFDMTGGARNTLIGNTSSFNSVGFTTDSEDKLRFIGNLAEGNIVGFATYNDRRTEYSGNTAQQNMGAGFVITYGVQLQVQNNVARANGGDGFRIKQGSFQKQELTNNYAINNGGHGMYVLAQLSPIIRLTGNTALGQSAPFFDLADDNPGCRNKTVWRNNTFATTSQDCIK